jgi:hypothetical protein
MMSREVSKLHTLVSEGGMYCLRFKHVVCVLPSVWTTGSGTLVGLPGASGSPLNLIRVICSVGTIRRRAFLDVLLAITWSGNRDTNDNICANGEGKNNERPAQVHRGEIGEVK